MKKFITVILLLLGFFSQAQGIGDWFNQKKTKIKLLKQQIAALQVYIGYAEKGYKIATTGLHAIRDIKNGEFNLHQAYFSSLKKVNPKIKHAAEVAEIIGLQISIVNHFKRAIKTYKASGFYNSGELGYVGHVYAEITAGCLQDIDALMNLITDNKLQMTDDERIAGINKLYADMQDKHSFTQSFTNDGLLLIQQRQQEENNNSATRQLYNLK